MNHQSNSAIQIRRATSADAQKLSRLIDENAQLLLKPHYSALQLEIFLRYYSTQAMHEKLKKQIIFCAEINHQLVGTIALEGDFVVGFYTEVSRVNQGIGSALLDYLENHARTQGLDKIQLSASPVGVHFYERKGWKKMQDIVVDYLGVGFEETLMQKCLK
ncbi:GNAT family N-acetyltransferase [Flavobacterium sp. CYK-55]|uniref:GNAT family N-acetyltransferase n=1 Tax=Flavobacterium sp. CYK-55 TaxID=2835529 RepID=UPI001BCD7C81|nr:GNAT family N-acetyltransferase [Flavobacterium sp. CYK-55]MBS7786971.1 GNAT family N-acetyltransferase [Flavobacterium sp. CYK-55]